MVFSTLLKLFSNPFGPNEGILRFEEGDATQIDKETMCKHAHWADNVLRPDSPEEESDE